MHKTTRALLWCGIVAGPLFVTGFIIQAALRSDYNPLRHPVSSLAIGDTGWVQTLNFLLAGLLTGAFAVGLHRIFKPSAGSMPWLIGITGLGLIGAGIFTTDPVYGYPSSAPLKLAQFTVRGHLHDLFSIMVFIGLPAACLVFHRRLRDQGNTWWAGYSIFTAIFMLLTFFLAGIAFKQLWGLNILAGVFQRLSILSGCVWMSILAKLILNKTKQ